MNSVTRAAPLRILTHELYIGDLPNGEVLKHITFYACYTEGAVEFIRQYINRLYDESNPYTTEESSKNLLTLIDYEKTQQLETWLEQVAD